MVEEALKLQQSIKENNLSTYVSGECVSACTLVFLAGKHRYLRKYARIGFHAYSTPGVGDEYMDFSGAKNDLVALGVKRYFVDQVFQISKEDMWYPSIDELISAGVVHEEVSGKEFQLAGTDSSVLTHDLKDMDNNLDKALNAESAGESLDAIKRFNKNAEGGVELLRLLARSSSSIQFVELTQKQNDLGARAVAAGSMFVEIEKSLENIDPETEDEGELEVLVMQMIKICRLERDYIPVMREIVSILEKKVVLSRDPIVVKELFNGDTRLVQAITSVKDNQRAILDGEIRAYQDLSCDSLLSEI
ncbi:MAG TPA: hypothetical protein EYN67_06055 [Flavobacteriales bacterium]|nr:hypothetical protein [Flavobacteriales bacterium]